MRRICAAVVLAVACAVVGVLYGIGVLQLFTSTGSGPHLKHAVLFAALAIVCLVGASFLRPRPA